MHGAGGEKRLLHGVQTSVPLQSLDRRNGMADRSGCGRDAGMSGSPVEEDRARTALALSAAVFGPGETEPFTQDREQAFAGFGGDGVPLAVDEELDGHDGRTLSGEITAPDRACPTLVQS